MSVDQIISQLEKAGPYSNGSRALDKEIALIFGWVWRDAKWYSPETVERARKRKKRLSYFWSVFELPHFTSSIPDTMKLFKTNPCPVILWNTQEWFIEIWKGGKPTQFTCPHLPSVLCIAALKARAA